MTTANRRLLAAAQALLAARADGMLTSEEWDALEAAVAETAAVPTRQPAAPAKPDRYGLQLHVLVERRTLLLMQEHAANEFKDAIFINDREALIRLGAGTLTRLLAHAEPGDTRIDDVIRRVAL